VKRYLKIIVKIHGALLLGFLSAIIVLEHDVWFKDYVERTIQSNCSEIIQAPFTCSLKKLNLLSGEIVFEHITSHDPNKSWSFTCPVMTVHFSWLSFLVRSLFDTHIAFYQATITSDMNGTQLAVEKPIRAFLDTPSTLPLRLKTCTWQQTTLQAQEKILDRSVTLLFSSTIVPKETMVTINAFCADGLIKQKGSAYAQKLSGTITIDIPQYHSAHTGVKFHLTSDLPYVREPIGQVTLFGSYKDRTGTCEMYNTHRTFHIKATHISYQQGDIEADVQVQGTTPVLAHLVPFEHSFNTMQGTSMLHGHIRYTPTGIQYSGTCYLEEIRYKKMHAEKCTIVVQGDEQRAQGTLAIHNLHGASCSGSWQYSVPHHSLTTELTLSKPLELSKNLVIQRQGARCSLKLKDADIQVTYAFDITYLLGIKHTIVGKAHIHDLSFVLQGTCNSLPYELSGTFDPFVIQSCLYKDKKGTKLISLSHSKHDLEGTIEYSFIKNIVHSLGDYELPGEGTVAIALDYTPEEVKAILALKDINIRIPYIYNIIKRIDAHVALNLSLYNVHIHNALVELHKGKAYSLASTLSFSPTGELLYAHIPLSCNNCLVSWQKSFFGLLSGALTLTYEKNGPSFCKGLLTLEKSTLHSNLLSSQVQKDFVSGTVRSLSSYKKDIHLDVQLQTRNPLKVKTGFLDTKARIGASLKGTLFNPELSGLIELTEGTLAFPYKPLYITGGKIHLMPGQLDDPTIELQAKNKIRKYAVNLSVTGSLQQPKVSFESSPTLAEEQIITLLLSGSEEGSLYLVMPNMIMQNMENLLFGSAESASKVQRYLKSLLKPLKNVRIIPTLSDHTAEGKGVHGALEIDINDRLRAKVQNNLNLSEDTQVEVEYSVSDDVSIKATKDDKGTLGGEVEMRWKF
jgi:hypothetical protein